MGRVGGFALGTANWLWFSPLWAVVFFLLFASAVAALLRCELNKRRPRALHVPVGIVEGLGFQPLCFLASFLAWIAVTGG